MDGFLVIDKQKGLTSHDVVARLRERLGIQKIGHTGTLDPMATGVLVMGLGKATRLLEYLVGLDKVYFAEITLGASSTTYDAEGEILPTEGELKKLKEEEIREALKEFQGEIEQVPPVFSAIKVNGERSYDLARAGTPPILPKRHVRVHLIELISYHYPKIAVRIHCSSGTYIRSIAHDLGQLVKQGGYLSALQREKVGPFLLEQAAELAQLDPSNLERYLLPLNSAQGDCPALALTLPEMQRLKKGQFLKSRRPFPLHQSIFAYFQNQLVAVLEYHGTRKILRPRKVLIG